MWGVVGESPIGGPHPPRSKMDVARANTQPATEMPVEMPSVFRGAGFDFQGQKLLLTYSTHLDKEDLIEFIHGKTGRSPKFIRCAHETGTTQEVPYEHTHVLIDFGTGKPWKCRDCRRLDVVSYGETLHPNWKPIKGMYHWRNCVAYLAKEDPQNKDLLEEKPSIAGGIWGCENLQDALLKYAQRPGDATGVIAMYNSKPKANALTCKRPSKPWHEEVIALMEEKPRKREIHWFYDPVGNTGKTHLARWASVNNLAYVVKQAGGSRDFATVIQNALKSGWNQRCIIFDLPRVAEQHSIYSPIEEAKDGCVTAVKYEGSTHWFKQPHVFVFANFEPCRAKLSQDRWRVHTITADGSLRRSIRGASAELPVEPYLEEDSAISESRSVNIINTPPLDNAQPHADRRDNLAEAVDVMHALDTLESDMLRHPSEYERPVRNDLDDLLGELLRSGKGTIRF